jgi:hypothetical protein
MGAEYGSPDDAEFVVKYGAQCRCGRIAYEVCADPVDAKVCHCIECQTLHGAPMQWAAIFHKRDVRFTRGLSELRFYNSATGRDERVQPCKVRCARCGTLIADEGRTMWLAFPTLFDFGEGGGVPPAFRPTCHIFYGARVLDVADDLPKWAGHKEKSARL